MQGPFSDNENSAWFSFMNPSVFNWFPTVTTSLVPGTSHLHYLRALRACTRQPSHCALFWHLTSGGVIALHLAHTCACTHTHTHSGSLWDCFSLKNTIKIESSYFFSLSLFFFNTYLFIWLPRLLVVAPGIPCFPYVTQDFFFFPVRHVGSSSLTRDSTQAPCLGSTES